MAQQTITKPGGVRLPPGPRGLPIVGSLLNIRKSPHLDITRIARKYGDVCQIRLGSVPTIVISHPDILREAFSRIELSDRWVSEVMSVMTDGGNDLAIGPYNERWRRLQRFANRELLSFRRVQQVRELYIEDAVDDLVAGIGQISDSNELLQPRHTLPRANARMMFSAIFGKTDGKPNSEDANLFETKLDELLGVVFWIFANASAANPADYIRWLRVFPNHVVKEAEIQSDLLTDVLNFLIDIVANRSELDLDNPTCLAEVMLAEERAGEIDRATVRNLIGDVIIAGIDTTAQTIAWLLLILANRPHIQQRIYEELAATAPDGRVGVEDKPNLSYLYACILESMRYKTVAPFGLPHMASRDCEVGGFAVGAGAQVLGNIYGIHHDERFWDAPYEFKPERFLPPEDGSFPSALANTAYMPFGTGRRACPGQGFAEIVIWLQACRLLLNYRFETPDGRPNSIPEDEAFGLSLMPNPYSLRVFRR